MRRLLSLMTLVILLAGCAVGLGNVRACYQGSHGMICGSGQGSTGQMGGYPPPHYGYQGGGQYFGQPMYVPPPVFYQPQVPPPTLFQPTFPVIPLRPHGTCGGYKWIQGLGWVCQGYTWGGLQGAADGLGCS